MKDNTHYFQHDYNASEDEKVIDLRADYGWEGYGIFWKIIEMLAQHNGKMHLHCNRIAFALQVDKQKIEDIINNYNLFEFEGEYFYSKRLLSQLNWREEIKQKRKKAAEKRWNDGDSNASAMQEDSKSNASAMQDYAQDRTGQDSTEKESKGKKGGGEGDSKQTELSNWLKENFPNVAKLTHPTPLEMQKLRVNYGRENVMDILEKMDNWKPLTKKNKYAYKTALKWLEKDFGTLTKDENGVPLKKEKIQTTDPRGKNM